jgi:hypothetical protein
MNVKYLIVVLFLCLSGCAVTGDKTVNVTEAQIQQKLNEKLSVPFSLLKIFDVNLSNSTVKFDQSSGRMKTTLDTHLNSPLLKDTLAGKVAISGKLRFDAATQSIKLDEPLIDDLNFPGLDGKYADIFSAFTKQIGGQVLNGLTLYEVKPEDLTVGNTHYQPKNMQITSQGLQITLSPQ